MDKITVYVNDAAVVVYRGMSVKHALIAYDDGVYKAAEKGEIFIEDQHGFRVGLEGALHPGAKLYVRESRKRKAATESTEKRFLNN